VAGRRQGGVTMHDVAAIAGVSIKTVSNVINGYPYIRPETKERVEAAIEQLG
jgi:DNA-binding LacI/PurR family transcriptional regulator